MINVSELYPDYVEEEAKDGRFYGPGNYQPIIDAIGNPLIQVDDRDYQGDSRILYENGGRYGILIFGWGSCSGCDALQACNRMTEIQDLANDLENNTKWFDSLEKLKEYVQGKDWELEYSWRADETKEFVKKILEL